MNIEPFSGADRPDGLRRSIVALVESPRAQRLIVALILLNAATLGLETFPALMARIGTALHTLDRMLLAIFVVELLLKLAGHGPRFFRSGWNVFDFVIVGVSVLPTGGAFSVLRALRVLRVLRLVSAVPKLRFVIESLARSLPGLGSIGCLMILFFYVFAVMATRLFGAEFPLWFGSLWASMFSLFQIMTLEGWADMAREVMAQQPGAWIFFLVFILLATFTVLNLFIAVIVNAMQEPHTPIEHRVVATSDDIAQLRAEVTALRESLAADGRRLSASVPLRDE